ncbi:MAG: DNA-3-methyladenine glycosylase [Chitinispirillales bacterium]|nr:DNA-3-methyladenine glycosylase [Chitinispirillales bacterium]
MASTSLSHRPPAHKLIERSRNERTSAPLGQRFFNRPTVELAKALLGKCLAFGNLRGKIVETEAYLYMDDPGCHAACGPTPRNAPMFGPAGRTYVYFIYGMYQCLNIVSGKEGEGEAVLIRALEPVDGIELMQKRRKTTKIENLCNGPGKLTQAFGITKKHNDLSLVDNGDGEGEDGLRVLRGERIDETEIVTATRIGLSKGQGDDLMLRFYIVGNRFVSKTSQKIP